MEKGSGLEALKMTGKDFLRTLENAVRFGRPILAEDVGEVLEAALEPLLLKQTFKQARNHNRFCCCFVICSKACRPCLVKHVKAQHNVHWVAGWQRSDQDW